MLREYPTHRCILRKYYRALRDTQWGVDKNPSPYLSPKGARKSLFGGPLRDSLWYFTVCCAIASARLLAVAGSRINAGVLREYPPYKCAERLTQNWQVPKANPLNFSTLCKAALTFIIKMGIIKVKVALHKEVYAE